MLRKKKESKLKEGLIGAAIGATAVGAAVILSDEEKRKKAAKKAKEIGEKLKEGSNDLKERVSSVRGRVEGLTEDGKEEIKEKTRNAKKKVNTKRQEES